MMMQPNNDDVKSSLMEPLLEKPFIASTVKPNDTAKTSWRDYPATRCSSLEGIRCPKDKILVKTGGNALQALDRSIVTNPHVVAITVPWYGKGGQTMLVRLDNDRFIHTQIPVGIHPGSVFLIKLPDAATTATTVVGQTNRSVPIIVDGVTEIPLVDAQTVLVAPPLDFNNQPPSDLVLQEEGEEVELAQSSNERRDQQ